jgi:hypothetical protein
LFLLVGNCSYFPARPRKRERFDARHTRSWNFAVAAIRRKEIDGLAARESKGAKVLLPAWFNLDADGSRTLAVAGRPTRSAGCGRYSRRCGRRRRGHRPEGQLRSGAPADRESGGGSSPPRR